MTGKTEKVAIITGGSQGIGAGLIAGYRRQGWTVMATARTINLDDAQGDGGDPDAAGGVLDRQRPGGRGQAALGQRGPHRGRAPSVCQGRPCSRALPGCSVDEPVPAWPGLVLAPGRRQCREPRYPGGVSDLQTRGPARASTGAAGCLERDPGGSTNPATNYAWLIPRRRAHTATARAGMPGADPPANPAITGSGMYRQETTLDWRYQ